MKFIYGPFYESVRFEMHLNVSEKHILHKDIFQDKIKQKKSEIGFQEVPRIFLALYFLRIEFHSYPKTVRQA